MASEYHFIIHQELIFISVDIYMQMHQKNTEIRMSEYEPHLWKKTIPNNYAKERSHSGAQ